MGQMQFALFLGEIDKSLMNFRRCGDPAVKVLYYSTQYAFGHVLCPASTLGADAAGAENYHITARGRRKYCALCS